MLNPKKRKKDAVDILNNFVLKMIFYELYI